MSGDLAEKYGLVSSGIKAVTLQFLSPDTYSVPIPDNCVAWEAYVIGGAGSGGAVEGDGIGTNSSATPGASGSYAHGIRRPTPGATAITVVVGAPGAGVTTSNGAVAGNPGSASSASDGTVTFTAPGGGAGQAAVGNNPAGYAAAANLGAVGYVNDGGDVDGYQGASTGIINNFGASGCFAAPGGASPGGPWGNGKPGGTIDLGGQNNARGLTGGASPLFSSGNIVVVSGGIFFTGGAGLGGRSVVAATVTPSPGGGALGPGTASAAGTGLTAAAGRSTRSGDDLLILQTAFGKGSAGATGAASADADDGGGSGTSYGTTSVQSGNGGFKGASGPAYASSGVGAISGDAGLFAGSGPALTIGSYTAQSGAGRLGGSSAGAIAYANGATAKSGDGGGGYVAVVFYVKVGT